MHQYRPGRGRPTTPSRTARAVSISSDAHHPRSPEPRRRSFLVGAVIAMIPVQPTAGWADRLFCDLHDIILHFLPFRAGRRNFLSYVGNCASEHVGIVHEHGVTTVSGLYIGVLIAHIKASASTAPGSGAQTLWLAQLSLPGGIAAGTLAAIALPRSTPSRRVTG